MRARLWPRGSVCSRRSPVASDAIFAMARVGCGRRGPRPGNGAGRGDARRPHAGTFRPRDAGLLPRHGRQPRPRQAAGVHAGGDRRPQHVDGLDRRQRSPVGSPHASTASAASICSRRSRRIRAARLRAAQPLALPRAGQRAVLHARRPGPIRTASGCGSTCAIRSCPPDPFANAKDYPGVEIGARGKTVAVGSYYGEPTGSRRPAAVPEPGLRREGAPALELRPVLQRSRRTTPIAISSGRIASACRARFCHVGPESDQAAGGSRESEVGESELDRRRAVLLVGPRLQLARATRTQDSIFYQALHVSRPGTLDTSLVSTDNINNPRTMNAVYYLGPRMALAKKWGKETMAGGGLEQQAVQRLRAADRSAVAVLRHARARRGRRAC